MAAGWTSVTAAVGGRGGAGGGGAGELRLDDVADTRPADGRPAALFSRL